MKHSNIIGRCGWYLGNVYKIKSYDAYSEVLRVTLLKENMSTLCNIADHEIALRNGEMWLSPFLIILLLILL